MGEVGVKKWGSDDARQPGNGARVDAVAVEMKERQEIEDLHDPHRAEQSKEEEQVFLYNPGNGTRADGVGSEVGGHEGGKSTWLQRTGCQVHG